MAKAIKQFRFYENSHNNNYPKGITAANLISGDIFDSNNCFPILQLGIQALPGTKFYLNDAVGPIIIGSTGIYELDIDGLAEIVRIQFAKASIETIANNDSAGLIVDIIYDDSTAGSEG